MILSFIGKLHRKLSPELHAVLDAVAQENTKREPEKRISAYMGVTGAILGRVYVEMPVEGHRLRVTSLQDGGLYKISSSARLWDCSRKSAVQGFGTNGAVNAITRAWEYSAAAAAEVGVEG